MVNLELYKVFYTVAKCGSLTKAAEELYISQPAVSQAIKQLEAQLGGQLFNRTHKGMELTETGGKQIFGNESTCQEFSSLTSSEDKAEYVAYQIDYAFSNNLQLSSSLSRKSIASATDDYIMYNSSFDIVVFPSLSTLYFLFK